MTIGGRERSEGRGGGGGGEDGAPRFAQPAYWFSRGRPCLRRRLVADDRVIARAE